MDDRRSAGYRRIADYAAIGDCHGFALVARDGSIDWCTLRRFDADPVFCRLLDARKGGFLGIAPAVPYAARRAYLPGTNILQTTFTTDEGSIRLTDFMPVGRSPEARMHDYVSLSAVHAVIRIIDGLGGRVPLRIVYRPSVDFAARTPELSRGDGRIGIAGGPTLQADMGLEIDGDAASATVELAVGQRRHLILSAEPGNFSSQQVERMLAVTRSFWEEWIRYCRYAGPYAENVGRSALALKLLTFAPSGAIVAAPTTSLPETLGGERNWDYRFCWLRDASLALHALASLGYSGEAERFFRFLHRSCTSTHPDVQLMYGIQGETDLSERRLEHLDGYAGSRPVRVGNDAFRQRQLDVYGFALDAALVYRALGGRLGHRAEMMLAGFVDLVARSWSLPDQGIWEIRSAPRHFVHSKAMCWVAVDRAARLRVGHGDGERLRDVIAAEIRARGIDPASGRYCQAYDGGTDAAVLLLPMLGFEMPREAFEATVAAIGKELRRGDLVHRYRAEDGLEGEEGAFLICSFWLVDAMLALGRDAEARELFERLVRRTNDVGLLAEEVAVGSGDFLGNFPQAFTLLGLIGSAINLQLFEKEGREGVLGTYADRARRSARATFGWRGILAAMLSSPTRLRFFSSRRSKLAL